MENFGIWNILNMEYFGKCNIFEKHQSRYFQNLSVIFKNKKETFAEIVTQFMLKILGYGTFCNKKHFATLKILKHCHDKNL